MSLPKVQYWLYRDGPGTQKCPNLCPFCKNVYTGTFYCKGCLMHKGVVCLACAEVDTKVDELLGKPACLDTGEFDDAWDSA